MKILLTGAQGQVGQAVVQASKNLSIELIACDRQSLDITQKDTIKQLISTIQPDVIINAAAYTAVDRAETEIESAFAINALGPAYLAEVCKTYGIPLLHLSTDYVFNGKASKPYQVHHKIAPLGVYGQSKWEGEEAIRKIHEKHLILRVSWVFGEYGNNFVKTMLRLFQEREEVHIVNDQQGCPTYASDIAEILLSLSQQLIGSRDKYGTYHYCGTPKTTWYKFAQAIYQQAKKYIPLTVKSILPIMTADYPTPAVRPKYSVLDCQRFINEFKIHPTEWEQGLNKMLHTLLTK